MNEHNEKKKHPQSRIKGVETTVIRDAGKNQNNTKQNKKPSFLSVLISFFAD